MLSGNDIPFTQAQVSIHPPTLKEIAYIGEEKFFIGCELLNFSKNILNEKDKTNLESADDFDIFMSIMNDRSGKLSKHKLSALMVLTLIFPTYKIGLSERSIRLEKNNEEPHYITKDNFKEFKNILVQMFCLESMGGDKEKEYNPGGKRAAEIAAKLCRGRQKAAAAKNTSKNFSLFTRYASILAIAQNLDLNVVLSYTVYQLLDEFKRFELKYSFDITVKQKLAGAKDVEDPENWMDDIHS